MTDILLSGDEDDCDLFDGGGAPLYSRNAEREVIGALLMDATIAGEVVGLVGSSDFHDPFLQSLFRVFERAAAEGVDADKAAILDALGGDPEAIIDGRTAQQFIGYLTSIGFDAMRPVADAAQVVQELSERRAMGSANDIVFPEPHRSSMGLKMWVDQNDPAEQYEYLVEDLIPDRQGVLLIGETQTGKSFLGYHLGMALARAVPFFGRRILKPVGVVWLAYEAAVGAPARMRAYARYHGLEVEPLPFAVLTRPLPLWPNEFGGAQPQDPRDQTQRPTATRKIIEEIAEIQRTQFHPMGVQQLVVLIDTYNAATPGASEIDSEVVSKIRGQFHDIITELQATLIIVGHTNSLGKHRGNEQLTNNFDTVIKVVRKTYLQGRELVQVRDGDRREVRTMKVAKQREGVDTASHDFVLHVVEDGTRNRFGNMRTSCVVTPPTPRADEEVGKTAKELPKGFVTLKGREYAVWAAFVAALKAHGELPPVGLRAPHGVNGIKLQAWREELARTLDEVEEKDRMTKARARVGNFITKWNKRLVRGDNAFYWRTGLKVDGIDPAPKPEPLPEYDFDPADFPPN